MDLVSFLLSVALFYALVPGVLVTLPKGGSKGTVLVTHAVLFAVVSSGVMYYYWNYVKEYMTNYGPTCPNGFVEGINQAGERDCVPTGRATYAVNTGYLSNIPVSK
jgi:hypothetical protein